MPDLSPLQEEYQAYFQKKMEEFGVSSPADFSSVEKMKEFFNAVSDGWVNGKGEKLSSEGRVSKLVDLIIQK